MSYKTLFKLFLLSLFCLLSINSHAEDFKMASNKTEKYEYVLCDDFLDDTPMSHVIYIIKNKGAYFICPCGCNVEIFLSKDKWSYSLFKNKISIDPSIKVVLPCYSHFFIKQGKVAWC